MIDDGELDWKVVAIAATDPMAALDFLQNLVEMQTFRAGAPLPPLARAAANVTRGPRRDEPDPAAWNALRPTGGDPVPEIETFLEPLQPPPATPADVVLPPTQTKTQRMGGHWRVLRAQPRRPRASG